MSPGSKSRPYSKRKLLFSFDCVYRSEINSRRAPLVTFCKSLVCVVIHGFAWPSVSWHAAFVNIVWLRLFACEIFINMRTAFVFSCIYRLYYLNASNKCFNFRLISPWLLRHCPVCRLRQAGGLWLGFPSISPYSVCEGVHG